VQLDGRDWLFGNFSLADLETYAWLCSHGRYFVPTAFADAPRIDELAGTMKERSITVAQALALASNDVCQKKPIRGRIPVPI